MTNEERNTALYQKMFAEQDTYRKWLLAQPPDEILKHTYEYTVREDILLSLEYHDLTDEQASALMKAPWGMCSKNLRAGRPDTWMWSLIPWKAGPMR